MQWTGMIATWGIEILADFWNLLGFASSVIAVLLISIFALKTMFPIIRKSNTSLNLSRIGIATVAFGAYFLFAIAVYFAAGGFAANRSAWFELIVPHNPYVWCLIFAITGLPFLIRVKKN
jgi:magnesium-transporting ATPase (P-type)